LFGDDLKENNLTWDNCELHANSSNYPLVELKQEHYKPNTVYNPNKSTLNNPMTTSNTKKNISPYKVLDAPSLEDDF